MFIIILDRLKGNNLNHLYLTRDLKLVVVNKYYFVYNFFARKPILRLYREVVRRWWLVGPLLF